jgi:hypothetical protein
VSDSARQLVCSEVAGALRKWPLRLRLARRSAVAITPPAADAALQRASGPAEPGEVLTKGATMRRLAALLAALAVPCGAALADPPARFDPDASSRSAKASFETFARDWMARVQARGERDRANPRLSPGATQLVATYREVGREFETELQPTGRPATPYVGVLRYTERVVTCADLHATDCRVVSTLPVTEVFRLRDDRWVY